MTLTTNITCISLNYLRLDDKAIRNLSKAEILRDNDSFKTFLDKIGIQIDSIAIIKKCNAVIIVISYSEDLALEYVRGRVLDTWDEVSVGGIIEFKRDVKFFDNQDAIKYLAECAVGVHSVTTGDSQVLSQITEGLRSRILTGSTSDVFSLIAKWVETLAVECRLRTDIFSGNISLERLACELLVKHSEIDKTNLLIGFGKTGRLIAKILNRENGLPMVIVNRTNYSIEKEDLDKNVTFSTFESFEIPQNVGSVIVAVDNTRETTKLVFNIINKIRDESVIYVDLSTPPILPTSLKKLTDIKSLSLIAQENEEGRRKSINKVRSIIDTCMEEIVDGINCLIGSQYVKKQTADGINILDKDKERLIRIRAEMLGYIRSLLSENKFLEVITPCIVGISTDPPKVDKGGTFDVNWMNGMKAFLRQSNQIYKQICVSSSIKKIYEIGPFWRKEVTESYRHLQESIGLDVEVQMPQNITSLYQFAYEIIRNTNDFLVQKFALPNKLEIPNFDNVPIFTYNEAVELLRESGNPISRGEDFGLVSESKLGQLIKKNYCSDIFIITNYPDTIKKFYTKKGDGGLTQTFDVIVNGWELVSGAIRQTNGDLIRKSMRISDIMPEDYEFYINAIDGAPEHGGFCLGLDRLLAKILDVDLVSDAVPFPRTYKQLIP